MQLMTNADMESPPVLESEISATIVSLQERFEVVRCAAIRRVRGRLGNLSPDQENAVDSLTRGIIDKVLQAPIANLKNAAAGHQPEFVLKTLRTIFNLAT
jgi:glutamyl-tRNA reductase